LVADKTVRVILPGSKSDIASYSGYIYSENEKEYFCYLNTRQKKIGFINLYTGNEEYAVPTRSLDSLFDFSFQPPKFFVQNRDSIFILPDESKIIYLIAGNGNIRDSWDLSSLEGPNFVLSGYSSNPLFYSNNMIYVRYVPKINPFFLKAIYFKTPPELIIRLGANGNKIIRGGGWPDKYSRENYYDDYPFLCINTNSNPQELAYSYAADQDVYFYHNDSLIKKIPAKSQYIDTFARFNNDSIGDIEYEMKYMTTAPQYARIVYDKYRKLFYRIALHGTKLVSDDGKTIKRPLDRPWSVIVLDENKGKIFEQEFDPAQYAYGPMYVCKEGIMFPKRKKGTEESKDIYEWEFVIFKVNL
jgi:hypothetical protein